MANDFIGAGLLNERVEVLELMEVQGVYTWEICRRTWAKATLTNKRNNYSVHGIGAAGITFLMRRQPLTLGHALRYKGMHCFITGILPADRGHLAVEAALVEVSACVADADEGPGGRQFPAILTEKYLKWEQPEYYSENRLTYVLVTPKAINLQRGGLVTVDGVQYEVQTAHSLDPWKQEYEIARREDL